MNRKPQAALLLGFLLGLVTVAATPAPAGPLPNLFRSGNSAHAPRHQAASRVPLEHLPPHIRPKVQEVLDSPTIFTQGPAESFACQPQMYLWFLDHPDRTMTAWRRLGAEGIDIQNRGEGFFGWADGLGSDVRWSTVYPGRNMRVWYAEGQVKPTPMLPIVPVQCVVVLRHEVMKQRESDVVMRHQADVFVRTNSTAARLITRMMGPSIPHLAEDATAQLQMFFAAMAWYCEQHPDRVGFLLDPAADPPAAALSPQQILPASGPVAFPD